MKEELEIVLKFVQAGLAGVAVIALYFAYGLLKTAIDKQADNAILATLKLYMKICVALVVMSGIVQLTDTLVTSALRRKLEKAEEGLQQAFTGPLPYITPRYVLEPGDWSQHWGAGSWESTFKFSRGPDNKIHFYGETFVRTSKNAEPIMVSRWRSTKPIIIPDEGAPDFKFEGVREILNNETALAKLGPPHAYPTIFEFSGGKVLRGRYRGIANDIPEGTPGNLVLYLPLPH
jgi:hypothetical protein